METLNNNQQLIDKMENSGLIPVFFHSDIIIAKKVLRACAEAGITVFEFTNRGPEALEVFAELKKYASENYPELSLGIGTIFGREDAAKFKDVGADFIVSPALIPGLADYCKSADLLWIPGCATVSEVFQATQLGAQLVKVFPGNVLGADFVQATKAVMPNVKFMPTGGVEPTIENLKAWFRSGVSCVGMGSSLFRKDVLAAGKFELLQEQLKEVLAIIITIRN
ncbi:bifunctional 4-hydroxy-2-oxoglutarate aldolase/2-dehydro-3-deoxy-phosphogluconate aldolase [Peijinzhouia sedimentorum]